jgi:hypothetical protein
MEAAVSVPTLVATPEECPVCGLPVGPADKTREEYEEERAASMCFGHTEPSKTQEGAQAALFAPPLESPLTQRLVAAAEATLWDDGYELPDEFEPPAEPDGGVVDYDPNDQIPVPQWMELQWSIEDDAHYKALDRGEIRDIRENPRDNDRATISGFQVPGGDEIDRVMREIRESLEGIRHNGLTIQWLLSRLSEPGQARDPGGEALLLLATINRRTAQQLSQLAETPHGFQSPFPAQVAGYAVLLIREALQLLVLTDADTESMLRAEFG